jgi:UDP-N-acetylmuramoylalanine--D-glutamate ligase
VNSSARSKKEIKPLLPTPAIDAAINWSAVHAMVVGLGESGLAATKWLARHGAQVTVIDTRDTPPMQSAFESAFSGQKKINLKTGVAVPVAAELFNGVDMLIPGPGLSPREIHQGPMALLSQQASEHGIPIYGEIDLFEWAIHHAAHASSRTDQGEDLSLPFELPKVLAITGTNGKTTTTQMTVALLKRAGFDAQEAGNISPSLLDAVMAREDQSRFPQVWVLELSSFQLAIAQHFHPTAAALLNISEDHLDWHTDMADYIQAKQWIFGKGIAGHGPDAHFAAVSETAGVQCVLNRSGISEFKVPHQSNITTFGMDTPTTLGDFGLVEEGIAWMCLRDRFDESRLHRLMPADALRARGRHNTMNALAALALCQAVTPALAPLLHGLRAFEAGLDRTQWITQINDIDFINDSKGTNVGATVAALSGLGKKVVLIAGGEGKGQNFAPLQPAIAAHAAAVITIGRDGHLIGQVAQAAGIKTIAAENMDQAVQLAFDQAVAGQAVMLSPACASFDMFKNYRDRAQAFIAAVNSLAEEHNSSVGLTC